LISEITPTKKMMDSKQRIVTLIFANLTYNLTYKIGVGEGTFAVHLLISEITPTKK
jgi:hypothetical protein